jgi:hypothetical protein
MILYFRRKGMRLKMLVYIVGVVALLLSCASQPVDIGVVNPENIQEEDLVTLHISRFIIVQKMDNTDVNWSKKFYKDRLVKIPSGRHAFEVTYNDGSSYTMFPTTVRGQFERGNTYLLNWEIIRSQVSFHVFLYNNNQKGVEVGVTPNELQGNELDVISRYLKYVLNPTTNEIGNSVKLENDNYILIFKPDLVYTLTDKRTRITTEGRRGFGMDFLMKSGKSFLLETDITKMSREQFLASKYTENAQIILIPIACSETVLTYRYEKPLALQGTEIAFTITEIKK